MHSDPVFLRCHARPNLGSENGQKYNQEQSCIVNIKEDMMPKMERIWLCSIKAPYSTADVP